MYKENTSHFKALLHAIKHVIDIKDYFYQMKPYRNINGPWELRGYNEAEYAGDNNTRISVIGYIVLINGAVIDWFPRSQKKVKISVYRS